MNNYQVVVVDRAGTEEILACDLTLDEADDLARQQSEEAGWPDRIAMAVLQEEDHD